MTRRLLLSGGTVVTPDALVRADVLVTDGMIEAILTPGTDTAQIDAETLACRDTFLVPGFVDMHVHGGAGHDFSNGDINAVTAFHGSHGTTSMVATLACRPPDELAARASDLAGLIDSTVGAQLAGIHFEGPFLDLKHRGAHDARHLRAPDVQLAESLCEAVSSINTNVVTVAPELPGAEPIMRIFTDRGFLVALGHSNATLAQSRAAFEWGGSHVTHLANGMRAYHHRDPGLVGATLDHEGVTAEVIGDGMHVDPSVMRSYFRLLGRERMALVTDAVAPCGALDGEYRLGERAITVVDGNAYVEKEGGDPVLAGSTVTMEDVLHIATTAMGLTLVDAMHLLSTTPAQLLGLNDRGRIAVGLRADICLLDSTLRLKGVLVGGRSMDVPAA